MKHLLQGTRNPIGFLRVTVLYLAAMSSSAINSLVFDVGGVLLDWDPEYLYEELIPNDVERDAFLFNVCTFDWHTQTDAGVPFAQIIEEKKAEHDGKFDKLIEAWWTDWDEMCGGIFEGTFDIANMVRAQNPEVKVYGITNFSAETWPRLLELYPIFGHFFNDVIVSGEEKLVKPDAEIYKSQQFVGPVLEKNLVQLYLEPLVQ